jgi:iron complex outermembrane receptor protein
MFRRKEGWFLWLLTAVWTAPLAAQAPGSLSGRVTDPQNAAVPGAIVALYARDGAARFVALADAQGTYRFERLAAGEYLVEAQAGGFAPAAASSVRIERGRSASLDIRLALGGQRELVVVTAAGAPQPTDEVSRAVTVVAARELEERDELSIAEALRTVPGLRVQQQGGPGSFTNIKTRGLRNEDTAVLIDGLRFREVGAPQGDASGFLADLMLTDVDRLEVLRGTGSSLYGSNATGGVINIVTAEGGGRARGSVLAEGGSLGLFRGRARVAGGAGQDRLSYSAGLARLDVTSGVDGDDAARNTSGQGRVGLRISPGTTLSGRLYGARTFVALNTSPQAIGALPATGIVRAVPLALSELRRYESGTPISQLAAGSASFIPSADNPDASRDGHFFSGALLLDGRASESLHYGITYQRLHTFRSFVDGPAGVSFQPAGRTRTDTSGTIDTVNARLGLRVARAQSIDAGYEFESENYRSFAFPVSPTPNSSVDVTERSNAVFVQDQVRLLESRLLVSASFRAQFFALRRPKFDPAAASPYAASAFAAPPDAYTGDGSIAYYFRRSGTKLRGHAGNGYRAPSLYERFGTSFGSFGYSTYGDPRLRPDRSIAFDAGVDQQLAGGRLRASATWFYTRLQEVIIFDFSGAIDPRTDPFGRFGGYRNSGGGLARGLELAVSAAPRRDLDVAVSYTYTNADQRRPAVAGVLRSFVIPDHELSLLVTQRFGRRLFVNFDVAVSSRYLAPVFDPGTFASRAFEFDGIAKGDLVASYRIPVADRRALRIYGKVENLFDRRYYESGFRTPRATALGGLQFEF